MGLLSGERGRNIGLGIARAMQMIGSVGKPQVQQGLLAQWDEADQRRRMARQYRGLLESFSEQPQQNGLLPYDASTNPPIQSAAPASPQSPEGGLQAIGDSSGSPTPAYASGAKIGGTAPRGLLNGDTPPPGMSGGGSGLLAPPQRRGLLSPEQISLLQELPPHVGMRIIADRMFAGPSERKILKGADGFNYYADTGERVLPNVQAAAQGSGFTLGPGQSRFDASGRQIAALPGEEELPFETLSPEEVAQAGFRPGTIVQRDPQTGRLHTLQSPGEGQAVRSVTGAPTLRAQGQIRGYAAQAFGGTYNPLTGQFTGLSPEKTKQVLELADRATARLTGTSETNIAAAIRKSLKEMQPDNAGQAARAKETLNNIFRQIPGPGSAPAPQAAPASASPARRRATNPQTGEVIEFNEQTGQWEPVR